MQWFNRRWIAPGDEHRRLVLAEVLLPLRIQWQVRDIGMPEMDGYEVARRIRSRPEYAHIQLIALLGWGQEDDRHRTREAGFDYHFVKPVDIAALEPLLVAHDSQADASD